MSKRRHDTQGHPASSGPRSRRRSYAWVGVVLTLLMVTALAALVWRPPEARRLRSASSTPAATSPPPSAAGEAPAKAPAEPKATNSSSPAPASRTNAPPASGGAKPEYQRLVGKWVRPDGGYVIEVRAAGSDGRLDAAYYNPDPIHVARAEASLTNGITRVFLELQAPGYPGSTYTLAYRPEGDTLEGIYFQAALQQEFPVGFVRAK